MSCTAEKVADRVGNLLQDLEDLGRVFDGLLGGEYEPLAGPLRVYGPVHDGNSDSGVNLLMRYLFSSAEELQKALARMLVEKRLQIAEELGLAEAVARLRAGIADLRELLA